MEHSWHLLLAISPFIVLAFLYLPRFQFTTFKALVLAGLIIFIISTAVPIHTFHQHSPMQTSDCCLVLPSLIASTFIVSLPSLAYQKGYLLRNDFPDAVYFIPSQNRSPPMI